MRPYTCLECGEKNYSAVVAAIAEVLCHAEILYYGPYCEACRATFRENGFDVFILETEG